MALILVINERRVGPKTREKRRDFYVKSIFRELHKPDDIGSGGWRLQNDGSMQCSQNSSEVRLQVDLTVLLNSRGTIILGIGKQRPRKYCRYSLFDPSRISNSLQSIVKPLRTTINGGFDIALSYSLIMFISLSASLPQMGAATDWQASSVGTKNGVA